jgi:hypothetical protein
MSRDSGGMIDSALTELEPLKSVNNGHNPKKNQEYPSDPEEADVESKAPCF